jgi:hypothetical protein
MKLNVIMDAAGKLIKYAEKQLRLMHCSCSQPIEQGETVLGWLVFCAAKPSELHPIVDRASRSLDTKCTFPSALIPR